MTILGTPVESATLTAYVTSAEVAAYFASDPRAAAFLALGTGTAWYLNKATKNIDAIPFKGQTYFWIDANPDADEQMFQFPRVIAGMTHDWDDDANAAVVPQAVKDACCEEALALYGYHVATPGDAKRRKLQEQGVKSFSLGKLSESYGGLSASSKWKGLHSEEAYALLKPYIAGAVRALP